MSPLIFILAATMAALEQAPVVPPGPVRAPAAQPTFFTFETDEFWLNLHHFLYVLGQAEAKTVAGWDRSELTIRSERASNDQ